THYVAPSGMAHIRPTGNTNVARVQRSGTRESRRNLLTTGFRAPASGQCHILPGYALLHPGYGDVQGR
ncbi:MAG: hypothetical protein ABW101_09430, partial [Candidatus Thiodiazotropha sp.]